MPNTTWQLMSKEYVLFTRNYRNGTAISHGNVTPAGVLL